MCLQPPTQLLSNKDGVEDGGDPDLHGRHRSHLPNIRKPVHRSLFFITDAIWCKWRLTSAILCEESLMCATATMCVPPPRVYTNF